MRKFGFLHHYRKIRIEGINLSSIVNKCIKNGIVLRNLKWNDPLESTVEIQNDDFAQLKKTAGNSYKLTVLKEGGAVPLFKSMKANVTAIAGAFLLGALIFYQSLFVAEIRIDGYRSITEASIRQVISDAGLYEGVKKPDSYEDIKKALYSSFEDITWVSIYEEGRLIKVRVAESSGQDEADKGDNTPVNIVADRSGMIERIIPLQGNACVQKGDYVNKGDVLISGVFEYQSSDYSRGDEIFTMYSHAKGQALAKVPVHLTYYLEKNERIKEKTGSSVHGIYLRVGDFEADSASFFNRYDVSERKDKKILDFVKPLPVEFSFVTIEEIELTDNPRSPEHAEPAVEAVIRQYEREQLSGEEKILSSSVDYSESEGLLKADILLEVLQDIGKEKAVKIKKKAQEEKT